MRRRAKLEPGDRLLGQGLAEVLQAGRRQVRGGLVDQRLHQAERERGVADQEGRQRRAQGDVQTGAVRAEHARRGHHDAVGGHRLRGVAAQAEPVELPRDRAARPRPPGTSHSVIGPSPASGLLDQT